MDSRVARVPFLMKMRLYTKVILIFLLLALVAGSVMVYYMGPRNIIGMLRYDQRREGNLKVGDRAPDVSLVALDGSGQTNLLSHLARKPLIVIFGSYT